MCFFTTVGVGVGLILFWGNITEIYTIDGWMVIIFEVGLNSIR